jgi:hypothetical protein
MGEDLLYSQFDDVHFYYEERRWVHGCYDGVRDQEDH